MESKQRKTTITFKPPGHQAENWVHNASLPRYLQKWVMSSHRVIWNRLLWQYGAVDWPYDAEDLRNLLIFGLKLCQPSGLQPPLRSPSSLCRNASSGALCFGLLHVYTGGHESSTELFSHYFDNQRFIPGGGLCWHLSVPVQASQICRRVAGLCIKWRLYR